VYCYGRNNSSNWDLLGSFSAGNGTHNCAKYSYAGRTVTVSVDCNIAGQFANSGSQNCPGGAYDASPIVWPTT
jgi:hypothetical protein